MYDVFNRWILSSKCYLAAFIAITAFLMWPNIILEFNRNQRHPSSGFGGVVDYYRNRLTLILYNIEGTIAVTDFDFCHTV
jgi:hypothetical protein